MSKSKDLILREAVLNDLPVLKAFEQALIRYERPFASNLRADPISYYDIQGFIEHPDALLYVAEFKGEVVGSGYAQIQNSVAYKKPEQFVYLGFMYVHPEYRGKGINGKLIQKLVEWAKDKKIHEIQLDVYAENKSALVAYKKLGFKPDLLKMRL
jgi:ribosomal protein S18 acetylase RimI-like enzyme